MNTSSMTEADWAAVLDAAVSPCTAEQSAPPPPLKLKTADEIVAEEQRRADVHHSSMAFGGAATVPYASSTPAQTTSVTTARGVVFANQVLPTAPTAPSDSAVLMELRAIREELRAMSAMLAVAINNKLLARR
jgi:hypothetical protein